MKTKRRRRKWNRMRRILWSGEDGGGEGVDEWKKRKMWNKKKKKEQKK